MNIENTYFWMLLLIFKINGCYSSTNTTYSFNDSSATEKPFSQNNDRQFQNYNSNESAGNKTHFYTILYKLNEFNIPQNSNFLSRYFIKQVGERIFQFSENNGKRTSENTQLTHKQTFDVIGTPTTPHNVTHTINRKRYHRKRSLPNSELDFVKVKIQGIIFEVTFQRPDLKSNAAGHLRNLMKPYPHLLLDPQYAEQVITVYNPLVMQNQVCKEFERNTTDQHVANCFFTVNDVGALVDRPMHDRLHRLFFQITSSLGIPSITWLPNRVGQFEVGYVLSTYFKSMFKVIV